MLVGLMLGSPLAGAEPPVAADRDYAVKTLDRIARPVLESLAEGKLKERLPLGPGEGSRRDTTCLEAFGRTLAGIAPTIFSHQVQIR